MNRSHVAFGASLIVCVLVVAGCPQVTGRTTVTRTVEINDISTFEEINLDLLGSRILTKPDQETIITISVLSNVPLYVADTVEDAADNDIRIQVAGRDGHDNDRIVMLEDMLLQFAGTGMYTVTWRGELPQLIPSSGQLTPATWTVFAIKGSGAPDGLDAQVTVEFSYIPW